MRKSFIFFLAALLMTSCSFSNENSVYTDRKNNFNDNWQFVREPEVTDFDIFASQKSHLNWEDISLPHTAHIEPLVISGQQWQGDCVYRKFFTPLASLNDKHIALKFEGAMHVAEVFLNGEKLKTHKGGYLPFHIDLSSHLKFGEENVLVVKLNNENNPEVPPGKPIKNLDFNWYSGLYRNVWLLVKDKLHVSDPIGAERVGGGGVFTHYSDVSDEKATVHVQVDVNNFGENKAHAAIDLALISPDGETVANNQSEPVVVDPGNNHIYNLSMEVQNPKLWSPDHPNLYTLETRVTENGNETDRLEETIGIRTFNWTPTGFELNGEPLFLRGTNRHQEYPYIGYALSDNANYRDAYKIKEAGFNFVRLAHYPHSPSFMKACDELGLLTMDAIPGWQFFGNEKFQENAIKDVRKMVRRDRNHPSVAIWEASLNESGMTGDFMERAHQAVYEEYPQGDVYTCGWIDEVYDVFIPARQHGDPPHYWNNYDKNKPYFIAEYGDWEYYAQNAGFNQDAFEDLSEEKRNSRQLRGDGQKRLAQQALNYQEAHNSNLQGKASGDANWLFFDYNRGYAPNIEASGIMDIFRLPKFAYYFYKSQADIKPGVSEEFYAPFIKIANFYNDPSFPNVKVYSNCEEVELKVNGRTIERRGPDKGRNSTHLPHPPFTFILDSFEPGELTATGYVNGEEVAQTTRKTPGKATSLKVWVDECGKPLEKGQNDVVFLYAAVVDKNGTTLPLANHRVHFEVNGNAEIIGTNPINAEAGIATVLLKAGDKGGKVNIKAGTKGLDDGRLMLDIKE